VKTFKICEYLAKLQARAWLSHVLCAVANTLLKDEESTQDSHVLVCYFVKYSLILNFFSLTHQQSIWTPPHWCLNLHHPPIFTLNALSAATLPVFPGLGQAPNSAGLPTQ